MAEEQGGGGGQERSEEPTQKRLQDAKDKGQVARSRELNTTVILMVGASILLFMGKGLGAGLNALMIKGLSIERSWAFDTALIPGLLGNLMLDALMLFLPFMLTLVVAALLTPVLMGGWSFSAKALAPKFDKINPIKGLKRLFSLKGLMELLKAMAKVLLVASGATLLIMNFFGDLTALGSLGVERAMAHAFNMLGWSLLVLSSIMILISAVDVPFQLWQHRKQLKMTKQEVKDEHKNSEGDPEVKGHIRRMQQEMAMRRMMDEVPSADVVITNPTHFAVALRYKEPDMRAPIVVAKGTDLIAARIREIAQEHNVALFEAPPLARALYASTDLNDEIPGALYLAVAQVLAYVFQLKTASRKKGGKNPSPPGDLSVPDEYLH
ncbi:MAG: flagellar type III secretion system protein FlhB [Gammaproteobacteria bacterium]|nr:flagellar type III secretion system protein FlhB [Gammaproteobacteria bacterium]